MAVLSKARAAAGGLSLVALGAIALAIREHGRKKASAALQADSRFVSPTRSGQRKVAVNMEFLRRFMRLLRIVVPGVFTPEVGFAAMVAGLLAVRTSFDIQIIHLMTSLERVIVSRSSQGFVKYITRFCLLMLPISCVNALLKYGQAELALRFRERLTRYLYDRYLKGFVYYKVANLDNRIANADQLLTVDVERFASSVAEMYSNVSKPLLDIGIYAVRLTSAIGIQGPAVMVSYLIGSGMLLTWLRQPTGRFTVAEQRAEGHFRYINSRLITHSEEVAFYDGNTREKRVLDHAFTQLVGLLRQSQQFRLSIGVLDNMVAKYFATIVGYLVVSPPFLNAQHPRHRDSTYEQRMEDYFRSGKMLVKLSEALGRLVLSGRELTRLAGFTSRVTEMMDVLEDLDAGTYERTMVKTSSAVRDHDDSTDSVTHDDEDSDKAALSMPPDMDLDDPAPLALHPGNGRVQYEDGVIEFDRVPLVAPNGDVLVPSLSVRVESGMNVVVMGPNGCGKSSMFRILGELWPLFGGTLTKPARNGLFYIPQRPYLTLGNLRDQVIYPHSLEDMRARGRSDNELLLLLAQVQLEYLVDREGGWDVVADWTDVLSGGEKQRVAMARLFYHKPQFAILDECTSAVSVDVEGAMYSYCRAQGITLFTVSHRRSLWKYHEYVLRFDGHGSYEFRKIDDADEAQGS